MFLNVSKSRRRHEFPCTSVAVLLALLGLTSNACSVIGKLAHGDPAVDVLIKTDPPGARVTVDGRDLGLSPITFHDPSGEVKSFRLEIEKDGYEKAVKVVTRQWDNMRLTYRLDPIYFYSLTAPTMTKERETVAAIAPRPSLREVPGAPGIVSDVDNIPQPRKWGSDRQAVALVVGISRYRDTTIPPVQYARRDAETVAAYLESIGGVSKARIKLLTDETATASDLAAYVEEWLPRHVSQNSTVFFYFAGHGTPNVTSGKAFILPYDGHPDFSSKLYPLDRLYEKLDQLPVKEVVVMLDSCFSGATGRSVLPKGTRPVGISIENPVVASEKLVVLTAAAGTQASSDYDAQQHGLFTYFVLKGLRGSADRDKNGFVEIEELFDFVSAEVSGVASVELNRDQTPVLLPSREQIGKRGNIYLTVVSK